MIWISSPIDSTATIGQILASDRMPKPSTADTALPTPRPMARTRGTVTGPVVTPALSQATLTNSSVENIGARRLHTIMERLLENLSFDASDMKESKITIDEDYVNKYLNELTENEDLSRYIL